MAKRSRAPAQSDQDRIVVPKKRKARGPSLKDQVSMALVKLAPLSDARLFAELVWLQGEKQYKPGWAVANFREILGRWPEYDSIEAEPASEALLAWISLKAKIHFISDAMNKKIAKQLEEHPIGTI